MAKPKDIRMMVIYSGARLVTYNENFKLAPDILKSIDNVEGNQAYSPCICAKRSSNGRMATHLLRKTFAIGGMM